jgi:dTDP-4-dehydrorhamnose reductase
MKKKMLIIGSDGKVGSALYHSFLKNPLDDCQVFGTSRRADCAETKIYVDMMSEPGSWPSLGVFDVIIYCVSSGNIDDCDKQPEKSLHLNHGVIKEIFNQYAAEKTQFILISSQRVFDGNNAFMDVSDDVCPNTNYGRHKVLAETIVQRHDGLVIRCTKVLDSHYDRFTSFANQLMTSQHFYVSDQINVSLVSIVDLIQSIRLSVMHNWRGLLHLSGSDEITYFKAVENMASVLNIENNPINWSPESKAIKASYKGHVSLKMSDLFLKYGMNIKSSAELVRNWTAHYVETRNLKQTVMEGR